MSQQSTYNFVGGGFLPNQKPRQQQQQQQQQQQKQNDSTIVNLTNRTETTTTSELVMEPGVVGVGLQPPSQQHQQQRQEEVDRYLMEAAPPELLDRTAFEEMEKKNFKDSSIRELVCRGVVTFLAEFVSCLFFYTCLFVAGASGANLTQLGLLGAGLMVFLISTFTRHNAAHLDPITTILLLITAKYGLPFVYSLCHFLAQALAALVACLIAWGLTEDHDKSLGLGYEHLKPGYSSGQGFLSQYLGCLIQYSVFLWMITAHGKRNFYEQNGTNHKKNSLFALAIGFCHMSTVYTFGRICGANFGWYLHFFPGVISGNLDTDNWWIYFLAPCIAAFTALLIYWLYTWIENLSYKTIYKNGKIPTKLNKIRKEKQT